MDDVSDTLAAAIRYVEHHGFSVIPIKAGTKLPALDSWKEYQERKPTLEELERWFLETGHGVAIVTGAISGIVVVDVDGEEGERSVRKHGGMPRTPTVRTEHGFHYYFRHPGGHVANRAHVAPGVDIRGDGGYAVAPR